jgi:YbbR domain-containing protein
MNQQMIQRIKEALTNNLGLKLLAVILSMVLWLMVVNVDDPSQTKTFTTTVTVINDDVLTQEGKFYEVPDSSRTVSFRVTARRSVIERLSGSDFTATADMNYLEDNGRLPVTVMYDGVYSGISISTKQLYMQIIIGEEMSVKYQVEVETVGEPARGSAVTDLTLDEDDVTVTGPVDVVQNISRVVAYLDVEGANSDMTYNAVLHFLDSSGNEVDQSRLRMNRDRVAITARIVHEKTVNVEFQPGGTLAEGLQLDGITLDTTSVTIMGDSEILNDISAIVIPPSVINLSLVTESMQTTVDLTTYLPEGVSLADNHEAQVTISVQISVIETKKYTLDTANLQVQNLSSGLKVTFAEDTLAVEISGTRENLANLSEGNLKGTIDVEGLTAGTYTVPIRLDLDEELFTPEEKTIQIEITE